MPMLEGCRTCRCWRAVGHADGFRGEAVGDLEDECLDALLDRLFDIVVDGLPTSVKVYLPPKPSWP